MAYLDEAGGTGQLASATSPVQPVFIPAAIVARQSEIRPLTLDFLHLKQKFFPRLLGGNRPFLDGMLAEVKGSEIRKHVRKRSRRRRRHAIGFLDGLLDLLEQHEVEVIGRVWVKAIGRENNGRAMYTFSTQDICASFQQLLRERGSEGLVIADSRTYPDNTNLSHSIFTRKFSARGDGYDRILEMPTFGHSDNHAGLQIADLVCSALFFPMATYTYCHGIVTSVHVHERYKSLRDRYGGRLRQLLYTYRDGQNRTRGGMTVSDNLGKRPSHLLFG